MCGIATIFSPEGPVSTEALTRATQALHHRGPDGQRLWLAPHRRVGMGHARLSIIDLTTGDQPIANEDEQIHIVVNGEFYDYERIQKELEGRGHRLRTRSDSEILLHLYEDYGTHCMTHLRGEFAFVLWDERNGLLFAARDRFGIKPLYYAQIGDTLYLASEAKALFAAGVPAAWDRESVYQDLSVMSDGDRSLFRNIYQVPPGHYLLATRHRLQVMKYWDHQFPALGEPEPPYSDAEHIERMRDALLEATRLRLRADVPVGCYLSGGLDSCTLLGMAMTLRSDPIEAFTIAFEEGPFDEGPVAEEMARHVGANFHRFRMPQDMLADHFVDSIAHCETTSFNAGCTAKYLLSKHVRDYGFKVVLTGEGSDEIFGGYPHFRRDLVLYNSAGGDADSVRRKLDELLEANKDVGKFFMPPSGPPPAATDGLRRALGFVPSWMEQGAYRQARLRSILHADFAAEFAGRDPFLMLVNRLDVAAYMAGREPLYQSMYSWLKTLFPNKLLNFLGDRMEMAHSIEGRTPFMDHHLVELVHQLPLRMKIRGMTEKYILREAARPYITDTVYHRQKHPFSSPFHLKGKLQQLVQDTLRGPDLAAVPFYNQAAVVALLDDVPAIQDAEMRDRLYGMFLTILSVCALQTRYRLAG